MQLIFAKKEKSLNPSLPDADKKIQFF